MRSHLSAVTLAPDFRVGGWASPSSVAHSLALEEVLVLTNSPVPQTEDDLQRGLWRRLVNAAYSWVSCYSCPVHKSH